MGEFYSVALTNNKQQADTGTKMIHVGKHTRSRIVSKGISAGQSQNCYRGLVQVMPSAIGARNYSQCDSMLIGDNAAANTYPYLQVRSGPELPGDVCEGLNQTQMVFCTGVSVAVENGHSGFAFHKVVPTGLSRSFLVSFCGAILRKCSIEKLKNILECLNTFVKFQQRPPITLGHPLVGFPHM